ncbi:50S ribosomal protein L3 N(5)-glutamine methyltransferase [Teredinibacter waterburyi]|uniref:50S ribosomal protein L3 N(5)-glutamine methyltransferase n=1 Tax=Teredinibacter waterburyi TaxID=1500538 RepID=UPI00165FF1DF|nr:50S ribosomal protein L3 N(5)-glutamine methyltransferase [Teredinibacter waterburyi]
MPDSITSDLITLRDWIRWGASKFSAEKLYFGHGTDNSWDEAAVLALWAINQPWQRLDTIYDCRLTLDERDTILSLFQRRIADKVPAAYLTGEAWFGGLKFRVNHNVLVPRSPVAELITAGFEPWLTEYPEKILDLCTGSGCIGILCATVFEGASVDISDISTEALEVARTNVGEHEMSERVTIIESDLFKAAEFEGKRYNLIVSNPPYVDNCDLSAMPAEYQAEPALGLGSGVDGLDITRKILQQAANFLTDDGMLVVEVGNSWVALAELYPEVPFFWPEFENGGHGVFVLTAEQLRVCSDLFV